MNDEYRKELIAAEQEAQGSYDRAIASFSASALGLSFIVIEDLAGDSPVMVWAVIAAWSCWSGSIASVITSYFLSSRALRKAILQTDSNDFSEGVGGFSAVATQFFNLLSGVLFIGGIIFLIIFTVNNFGGIKP